jgi:hypothetical protein
MSASETLMFAKTTGHFPRYPVIARNDRLVEMDAAKNTSTCDGSPRYSFWVVPL